MSSISSISSSSANNAAAIYQENLARQLAAKQNQQETEVKESQQNTQSRTGDVDRDGDSK